MSPGHSGTAPVGGPLADAVVVWTQPDGRYARVRVARPDPGASRASARAYTRAGQYLRLAVPGDPEASRFFAVAESPGAAPDSFELLIRPGGRVANYVIDGGAGTSILMSEPEGAGFPMERGLGRDLVLIAAGSGIAPIRALLGVIAARRAEFGRVTLLYGENGAGDFAYRDELPLAGADELIWAVVEAGTDWTHPVGFPQHIARDRGLLASPASAVYACGVPEMLDELGQLAAGEVLTNV